MFVAFHNFTSLNKSTLYNNNFQLFCCHKLNHFLVHSCLLIVGKLQIQLPRIYLDIHSIPKLHPKNATGLLVYIQISASAPSAPENRVEIAQRVCSHVRRRKWIVQIRRLNTTTGLDLRPPVTPRPFACERQKCNQNANTCLNSRTFLSHILRTTVEDGRTFEWRRCSQCFASWFIH